MKLARPAVRAVAFAAVLAGALAMASCTTTSPVVSSASLIDLDKEWTTLYTGKLDAETTAAGSGASFNARLADLSTRAEAQGDALSASNAATAVGFYRIAATSAWKAGAPRDTQVLPIRDKGAAACARLPQGDASQPRDCAFIKVAPFLAALDARAVEIQALRDAGTTLPANRWEAVETVTRDVAGLMKNVLETRAAAGDPSASFDSYLKFNLTREFCMLQGLVGRFAASDPPEDRKRRVIEAAREAQGALQNATVSTTCN
ncbi:MAG: hypothetical protein WDO56_18290 [Gammaproteobacteria bacterium]